MNEDTALNKRIAEALHGKLHYVVESGETFFYRVGVDDLNDIAYDVLEDYANSLDAVWQLFLDMPDDYTPRLVRILQPVDGVMEMWTKASILHNQTHDEISAVKRDACAAICEAWLMWKDGTHG